MADEKIKPGDTVRVKSGGPLMTVDEVKGTAVSCTWFEGPKRRSDVFSLHLLERDDGI